MAARKKKTVKVEEVSVTEVVETETTEDAPEVSVTETDETTTEIANDGVETLDTDSEGESVEGTVSVDEVSTEKKVVPVQVEGVPDKMFNLKRMHVDGMKYANAAQNFVEKEIDKKDIADAIANKDYTAIDKAYFGK